MSLSFQWHLYSQTKPLIIADYRQPTSKENKGLEYVFLSDNMNYCAPTPLDTYCKYITKS